MKKVCCFILCALLMLVAASAMADCATDGHSFDHFDRQYVDGTKCMMVCSVCGETDPSDTIPHCVMCTTGTECVYCGTAVAQLTSYEKWCSGGERLSDATHCWEVCEYCGEEIYKTEHDFPCNRPETCSLCGAPNTTGEVTHWFVNQEYDETHCWHTCGNCGVANERTPHWAPCTKGTAMCEGCGQPCEMTHQWEHTSQVMGNCVEGTKNTFVCADCGEEKTETEPSTGECWFELAYDADKHWFYCTGCGLVKEEQPHYESCDSETPNTCYLCEQPCEPNHPNRTYTTLVFPSCIAEGTSQVTCNYCGEQWTEVMNIQPENHFNMEEIAVTFPNCKEDGSRTLKCLDCGAEVVESMGTDGGCWYVFVNKGDTHVLMCEGCGAVDSEDVHYISCTGGSTCMYCGATGVSGDVAHNVPGDAQGDANSHWWECVDCNEKVWAGEHHAFCDMDTTVCMSCGKTDVNIVVYHGIDEDDLVTTATEHWWACPQCKADVYRGVHEDLDGTGICYCGEPVPAEEHDHEPVAKIVVAATCTEFGLEQSVCAICGEVLADKELYPTGHNWAVSKTVDATCEQDGRINYACENCDATSLKKLPATGHTLVDGVCACGYAEEVPAAQETEEAAEIAVKPVENVTVEAAEGEALSSDVALIVNEPEEDVTETLPEAVRETVKKVYYVTLTEKGEAIEPAGSLKVSIQLEEGADLTNQKLMLIKEDGTLVEIAYEVIEGKLVFVTDAIGTFVLVDAPAE